VRRTVPPSAELEEQIDRLLAVGVGENPRESLSELGEARRPVDHPARSRRSSPRGWAGRAMSAGRTISAGCATAFARAGCRPPRASSRRSCHRSERRPSRSCPSSFPVAPSCSGRAAAGDGDRLGSRKFVPAPSRVPGGRGRAAGTSMRRLPSNRTRRANLHATIVCRASLVGGDARVPTLVGVVPA